jgi:hypothetical protein
MLTKALRKWIAFGTGAGIEIGPAHLTVSVVRVRPNGAVVLGSAVIENFRQRPAADWGREYAAVLKQHGASHVAAVVLVPRQEVIVRTLSLPGVKESDLAAAAGYQLDALHPYGEDDAVPAWARLNAVHLLIGIVRRQALENYMALFAEAGVKVASFTFSAAAIRSAIRMLDDPPRRLIAGQETADGFEVYGESDARPVFSAVFDLAPERALALAAAELRLPDGWEPSQLGIGMSHAAAMCSACPVLSLDANLLPESQRRTSSKLRYVPTAVLGVVLTILCIALFLHKPYDEQKYREALQVALAESERISGRSAAIDKSLTETKGRVAALDEFRARTKADLDLLRELTAMLEPPAYLTGLDVTRDVVTMAGEAEQAAPMVRLLDSSPRLTATEPISPFGRMGQVEIFRLRSQRETPPASPPPQAAPGATKQ